MRWLIIGPYSEDGDWCIVEADDEVEALDIGMELLDYDEEDRDELTASEAPQRYLDAWDEVEP